MTLDDAEDLWLACLLQAPTYLVHSLVGDEQLSPRGRKIVGKVRGFISEGWPQVTPEQLELTPQELRTIGRRYEIVAATETIKEAERSLIDQWVNKEMGIAYRGAAEICAEEGREQSEAWLSERRRKLLAFGGSVRWTTSYEVSQEWIEEQQRLLDGEGPPAITSGFDEMDKALRGYQPQCMTVLGGYTNDGKSTAAVQLLTGMAMRGTPTCLISLEDRKQIPVKRQIQQLIESESLAAVISNDDLRGPHLDKLRHETNQSYFKDLPFVLEYGPGWSPERVGYALQDAARNYGCRVGMVDYLQCFRSKGDRRVALGDAAATLKTAAAEVGMHLILVSQIVRPQSRDRKDSRPNMFMLKESGDIENIAEYVAFIWRPNRGDDVAVEEASWILDKSKDSAPVEIMMGWSTVRNCFTRTPPTLPTEGYTY